MLIPLFYSPRVVSFYYMCYPLPSPEQSWLVQIQIGMLVINVVDVSLDAIVSKAKPATALHKNLR